MRSPGCSSLPPVRVIALTGLVWPSRVRQTDPLSRSHTLRVQSAEAETAQRP